MLFRSETISDRIERREQKMTIQGIWEMKRDESRCKVGTESEGTTGNKVRKAVKCCQRSRSRGRGAQRPARYCGYVLAR